MPHRHQHRRLIWLALWAVLAAALLPTISHALAQGRGDGARWAEVCTAQGMRLVVLDDATADTSGQTQRIAQLEHCPYCALGAGAAPLPAAPGLPPLAVTTVERVPALFLHAPRTLHAWRSAQPRGPPAFS